MGQNIFIIITVFFVLIYFWSWAFWHIHTQRKIQRDNFQYKPIQDLYNSYVEKNYIEKINEDEDFSFFQVLNLKKKKKTYSNNSKKKLRHN